MRIPLTISCRGYRCPLCMHSALDMTRYWRQLDTEVAQTPMPSEYQNVTVDILCNDCNGRSTVQFHILGMKCKLCDSYNTAQAGGRRVPVDQQWEACPWLENSSVMEMKLCKRSQCSFICIRDVSYHCHNRGSQREHLRIQDLWMEM